MSESHGGNLHSRLEHLEAFRDLMIEDHEQFRQEHKLLLTAQVVMQDNMNKLVERMNQLADAHQGTEESLKKLADRQEATDEKLSVLIAVLDDWIRRH